MRIGWSIVMFISRRQSQMINLVILTVVITTDYSASQCLFER